MPRMSYNKGIMPVGISCSKRRPQRLTERQGRSMTPARIPASSLPLKPNILLILMAMQKGEAHGYSIKRQVEELSDGAVRLDPGTLYRLVGRLLEDGLIEESDRRPDEELDDARRRYYRLTELGEQVTAAELDRLAVLLDAARSRKMVKRPRPV